MAERVVLDAGVALAWVLPTDEPEQKAYAGSLIRTRLTFVVPSLWHIEVAAVLMRERRAGEISAKTFHSSIEAMRNLRIETHAGWRGFEEVLALAGKYHLQAADAVYFDLAFTLNLPIASLDGGIRTACRVHRVRWFEAGAV